MFIDILKQLIYLHVLILVILLWPSLGDTELFFDELTFLFPL